MCPVVAYKDLLRCVVAETAEFHKIWRPALDDNTSDQVLGAVGLITVDTVG
jgi:hypothetical protein